MPDVPNLVSKDADKVDVNHSPVRKGLLAVDYVFACRRHVVFRLGSICNEIVTAPSRICDH